MIRRCKDCPNNLLGLQRFARNILQDYDEGSIQFSNGQLETHLQWSFSKSQWKTILILL